MPRHPIPRLALLSLVLVASLSGQQPNQPTASMVWAGQDGPPWPVQVTRYSNVPGAGSLTLEMDGTPGQNYAVTHTPAGLLTPPAPLGPFGISDQDFSGGFEVLINGLIGPLAGFPGILATFDAAGESDWIFPVPYAVTISLPGMQGIASDPAAPFGYTLTAATALSVFPAAEDPCAGLVVTALALADDDSVMVSLTGSVSFFGTTWTELFVNSNGNITFGAGDIDWTATEAEFFADEPRIAPLWYDLSPSGGVVGMSDTGSAVTVAWVDVESFGCSDTSSLCVRIEDPGASAQGSPIEFRYGEISTCATSTSQAIVGLSPGSSTAADAIAGDFSTGALSVPTIATAGGCPTSGPLTGTVGHAAYETFTNANFDLGPFNGATTGIRFTPQAATYFQPGGPFALACAVTHRWYTATLIP